MTWKKYFRVANLSGSVSPINGSSGNHFTYRNYQSNLPDVYIGHPNRIERYNQYEQMDMDSEVNAALDILSEFSTQINKENSSAFQFVWKEKPTDNEIKIIKEQLTQWVSLNELNKRIFKIFRNTIKYGDQVFIRDPETFKLFWVEMSKVVKVIVNEAEGKKPEQYIVKELAPNFENLTATALNSSDVSVNHPQVGGPNGAYIQPKSPYSGGSRFSKAQNEQAINAEHIVHLSLTEGLDFSWPFGNSVLENVFKVFKQKELLEDAIIIYRVQRAPERRIFYIDVGNMPSHMAMAFVERVKNEVHQRRIPTQTGGGQNMMDATYNPLCLDLGTVIPLLDGRKLTLAQIIEEFNEGKENWAYSCDPDTGKIVPGVINWAGVTRKNTEVLELTFDNGQTLICTPDHKIPVFGKGFVEAKDIISEDSLIAFNVKNKKISNNGGEYQQVWDHEKKEWVWTHRMVGDFFRELGKHQEFTYLPENVTSVKNVIHHRNYDRFNNDPRNLTYMNKQDHILYHASMKKDFWENISDEYRTQMICKISETTKNNWKNISEEQRQIALWKFHSAREHGIWLRQNDKNTKDQYKEKMRAARKKYFSEHPEALDQAIKNCENRVKIKNQTLNVTFDMLQIVAKYVKDGVKNKNKVIELCDINQDLLKLVKENNSESLDYKNSQCKIDFTKFGYNKLDHLISKFGYTNWKKFVKEIDNFNHRVVKITKIQNRDTGTITIDGLERWHNYHTFAIDSGIFVKNSTNEDYFFPQTADGRGSKVDTLAGGTNLGEITDLHFFTNKLFRGLRIPASYLPTGLDDGTSNPNTFSDGRVGTALIQEWRFNQYCIRLQRSIAEKLDQEFKMFMRWRGINIDGSLFELQFNEPQNFASYRQAEVDSARITSFTQLEAYPYLSKRFLMSRFLGLTEEEMSENEKLWEQEQGNADAAKPDAVGLRSVGISPGGLDMGIDAAEMAGAPLPGGGEGEGAAGAAPGGAGGAVPPLPPPGPVTPAM
jgi:hypothetical protein